MLMFLFLFAEKDEGISVSSNNGENVNITPEILSSDLWRLNPAQFVHLVNYSLRGAMECWISAYTEKTDL